MTIKANLSSRRLAELNLGKEEWLQPFRFALLNGADWPVTESGHLICAPVRPRPEHVPNANNWVHVQATQIEAVRDDLALWTRMACPNCHASWLEEST